MKIYSLFLINNFVKDFRPKSGYFEPLSRLSGVVRSLLPSPPDTRPFTRKVLWNLSCYVNNTNMEHIYFFSFSDVRIPCNSFPPLVWFCPDLPDPLRGRGHTDPLWMFKNYLLTCHLLHSAETSCLLYNVKI